MTLVRSLGSTWWKERTTFPRLSSYHTCALAFMYASTHAYNNNKKKQKSDDDLSYLLFYMKTRTERRGIRLSFRRVCSFPLSLYPCCLCAWIPLKMHTPHTLQTYVASSFTTTVLLFSFPSVSLVQSLKGSLNKCNLLEF